MTPAAAARSTMSKASVAKFKIARSPGIGHAFRGVVFEVDPQFAEDEVSYETIGPIEGRRARISRSIICSPRAANALYRLCLRAEPVGRHHREPVSLPARRHVRTRRKRSYAGGRPRLN